MYGDKQSCLLAHNLAYYFQGSSPLLHPYPPYLGSSPHRQWQEHKSWTTVPVLVYQHQFQYPTTILHVKIAPQLHFIFIQPCYMEGFRSVAPQTTSFLTSHILPFQGEKLLPPPFFLKDYRPIIIQSLNSKGLIGYQISLVSLDHPADLPAFNLPGSLFFSDPFPNQDRLILPIQRT